MCEQLIDSFEHWLRNEKTTKEIEQILGQLCDWFQGIENMVRRELFPTLLTRGGLSANK